MFFDEFEWPWPDKKCLEFNTWATVFMCASSQDWPECFRPTNYLIFRLKSTVIQLPWSLLRWFFYNFRSFKNYGLRVTELTSRPSRTESIFGYFVRKTILILQYYIILIRVNIFIVRETWGVVESCVILYVINVYRLSNVILTIQFSYWWLLICNHVK